MGKLLVRMPEISERGLISKSRCRSTFSPSLSYILVGGLGGIGRAIATWMIERGARNLVFLSRSAGATSQDQSFRHELELQGSTVIMIKCDVTIQQQVQAAIHACPAPVGGILQLSMIVRVSLILPYAPSSSTKITDHRRTPLFQTCLTRIGRTFFLQR